MPGAFERGGCVMQDWGAECPVLACVHCCRLVDDFAARLYERAGYRSLQRDNPLVALFGMDRRALMRKRLR